MAQKSIDVEFDPKCSEWQIETAVLNMCVQLHCANGPFKKFFIGFFYESESEICVVLGWLGCLELINFLYTFAINIFFYSIYDRISLKKTLPQIMPVILIILPILIILCPYLSCLFSVTFESRKKSNTHKYFLRN